MPDERLEEQKRRQEAAERAAREQKAMEEKAAAQKAAQEQAAKEASQAADRGAGNERPERAQEPGRKEGSSREADSRAATTGITVAATAGTVRERGGRAVRTARIVLVPAAVLAVLREVRRASAAVRAGRDLARIMSVLMENVDRAQAEGRTGMDPVVNRARALLRRLPSRRTRSAGMKRSAVAARRGIDARGRITFTKRTIEEQTEE